MEAHRGIIIKRDFRFLKRLPRISLACKLVPVPYRRSECRLFHYVLIINGISRLAYLIWVFNGKSFTPCCI